MKHYTVTYMNGRAAETAPSLDGAKALAGGYAVAVDGEVPTWHVYRDRSDMAEAMVYGVQNLEVAVITRNAEVAQ